VPTLIDAAGTEPVGELDGLSFLPVLLGEATEHKSHVYGIMTTRGINNGSEAYGIRSVRSKTHQLIVNLNHEEKFMNACAKSPEFLSWVKRAESGKKRAAQLVNHYHHRPAIELYEVGNGWHNWENLADSEEHTAIQAALQSKLDAWMKDQGDLGAATEMAALEHQGKSRKKKKTKKP